ncbi:MAG TPA: enoyl-CoA hydratase/isomerase family protein [Solirubrobacteraceae bacterium]|nr:enoyl-CoA hydratase/isomerase family protein [Solirubrobacteraceae bacterium]
MFETTQHHDITVLTMQHGKANVQDLEFLHAFVERIDELEREEVGALVLTGSGSVFSAGVDLVRLVDGGGAYLREFLPALTTAFDRLFRFPRPVVAAVNGHAMAGGCVFVCACDRRLMAAGTARIGVTELRVGVPFPTVAFEIVRYAAGSRWTQELVLLAETYEPEGALLRGLVDEVVPPDELLPRALDVAARLGAVPRVTFGLTKRQLRAPTLARIAAHQEQFEHEIVGVWAQPEMRRAIAAFVDANLRRGRN